MSLTDLCDADVISQPYGCTTYALEWPRSDCLGGHFHAGIDLSYADGGNNHLGSPIRAARSGICFAVGLPYLGPHAVCIRSDLDGLFLEYGHMQAHYVNVGDHVNAGDHIGDLGTLGASTGGHLHLEVRSDGPRQGPPWDPVRDPTPYIHYAEEDDMFNDADRSLLERVYNLLMDGEHTAGDPNSVSFIKADLDGIKTGLAALGGVPSGGVLDLAPFKQAAKDALDKLP